MELAEIKKSDRILFNERKKPLEVKGKSGDEIIVKGPKGGEYKIYKENDSLLIAKPGNKRYSSYCKNLRKVGEWQRKNVYLWIHSKSGASLEIKKDDAGHYRVVEEGVPQFENPAYGFSSMEVAIDEVENFIDENPEG